MKDSVKEEQRSHSAVRSPIVGTKYRITDGKYNGRLAKVDTYSKGSTHAVMNFCDPWGKPTGERDMIPIKYLDFVDRKK